MSASKESKDDISLANVTRYAIPDVYEERRLKQIFDFN